MSSEYNLLREAFIRGHNGSTIGEILAITSVNQLTNFLMIAILSLIPILTEPKLQWIRYTIEFFIIMVPFALSVTILSDYNHLIYIAIIVLTFIAIILCVVKRRPKEIVIKDLLDLRLNYKNRLPFVSNLFSTLMQCVCISILAVDFHAFPRRFAKTEIYGYSLMDVGVGAFIAINGGFSPEARLGSDHHFQRFFLFKKTLFSTIPLIILGFQRLIAVKSLEYHEHITEYGLHWNFFFTLAITKTISTLFFILFSTKVNIGFCGIVVIIVYQLCLNCGLNEFIQNDNRIGLFAANKEGILSLLGYIPIYLIFVEIGKYTLKLRYEIKIWLKISLGMFVLSLITIVLTQLSNTFIEKTSRREVNLAFVLWIVSLLSLYIGLEFIIQSIVHCLRHLNIFLSGDSHKSIIFTAYGYSGMLVFLVANLLTGFINFTIDTMAVNNLIAFIIIIVYCIALSILSVLIYKYNIQIKLPIKPKTN